MSMESEELIPIEFQMLEMDEVSRAVSQITELDARVEGTEEVVETSSESVKSTNDGKNKVYACPQCKKSFTRFFTLRQHAYRVHGVRHIDLDSREGQIKCGFDSQCSASFKSTRLYRRHLVYIHRVRLQKLMMKFNTLDEFNAWKLAEEATTGSRFIKGREEFVNENGEVVLKSRAFNCCRSGRCRKETRLRTTMKIGTYCPAKMDLLHKGEEFILTYFSTHVGHGPLDNIYKTSLKKRMDGAIRRQKYQYKALQLKIKAKMETYIEKICQDEYPMDFLKGLSDKLDTIFKKENAESDKIEVGANCSAISDVRVGISDDELRSLGAEMTAISESSSEPCLEEHTYMKKLPTTAVPDTQQSTAKPSVPEAVIKKMYREIAPKISSKENAGVKNEPLNVILCSPKTNSENVILLTTTPGYPVVKQNCPVVLLDNSTNVLQYQNAVVQPSNNLVSVTNIASDNSVLKNTVQPSSNLFETTSITGNNSVLKKVQPSSNLVKTTSITNGNSVLKQTVQPSNILVKTTNIAGGNSVLKQTVQPSNNFLKIANIMGSNTFFKKSVQLSNNLVKITKITGGKTILKKSM